MRQRRHLLAYVKPELVTSNLFATTHHHYRESVIIRGSNEHNPVSIGAQDIFSEGARCDLSRWVLWGVHSAMASSYGAAGALIIVLLLIYHSARIFLLGAEFTKLYASRRGIPAAVRAVV